MSRPIKATMTAAAEIRINEDINPSTPYRPCTETGVAHARGCACHDIAEEAAFVLTLCATESGAVDLYSALAER